MTDKSQFDPSFLCTFFHRKTDFDMIGLSQPELASSVCVCVCVCVRVCVQSTSQYQEFQVVLGVQKLSVLTFLGFV